MDKHSAHFGNNVGVRDYITSYFRPFFLPTATSQLNSAENLFAHVKHHIRKYFLFHDQPILTQDELVNKVQEQLQIVAVKLADSRVFFANLRDIKELIIEGGNVNVF